jgi:hypothetical protein
MTNSLPATTLRYRSGTASSFLAAMLAAAASRRDRPDDVAPHVDDIRYGLLDAWACTLDVLTFYTERIANENYFRTATELRSLLGLARQVGTQRSPGVAAEAPVAFTMETGAGVVTVPVGTQVLSIPAPLETPQTFETVEPLEGRPEWNALQAMATGAQDVDARAKVFDLLGPARISPGDVVLVIASAAAVKAGSSAYCLRTVVTVVPRAAANATRIELADPALYRADAQDQVPGGGPEPGGVFAFRQRALFFGANAPVVGGATEKWKMFGQSPPGGMNSLDLDQTYPAILNDTWIVLQSPTPQPAAPIPSSLTPTETPAPPVVTTDVFLIVAAATVFRTETGPVPKPVPVPDGPGKTTDVPVAPPVVSGRITRVVLDRVPPALTAVGLNPEDESGEASADDQEQFWRSSLLVAQSEALALAPVAVGQPVGGSVIQLAQPVPAFSQPRQVIVTGRAPTARVPDYAIDIRLCDGTPVPPGTELIFLPPAPVAAPPSGAAAVAGPASAASQASGLPVRIGALDGMIATAAGLIWVDAPDSAPVQTEMTTMLPTPDTAAAVTPALTDLLTLDPPLAYLYDCGSFRIAANVARATHGETVGVATPEDPVRREVLGSGDSSPYQSFQLAKPYLTYVRNDAGPPAQLDPCAPASGAPPGAATTLEVEVNGITWTEVDNLAYSGPDDHHYYVREDDSGTSTLIFGDGVTGARLPTGQENVAATYRAGLGTKGNLQAGQLAQLLTKPLGVRSVTNPMPSWGGVDPDGADDFRTFAMGSMHYLERVVALSDYEDFVVGHHDVAKSLAVEIPIGGRLVVHVTVAATDGAPHSDPDLLVSLATALGDFGDPHQLIMCDDAEPIQFDATIEVYADLGPISAADAIAKRLEAAARAAVRDAFGFAQRGIAQPVTASELVATVAAVAGVDGAALTSFSPSDSKAAVDLLAATKGRIPEILVAEPTRFVHGAVRPAQLLTVRDAGLVIQVLPSR